MESTQEPVTGSTPAEAVAEPAIPTPNPTGFVVTEEDMDRLFARLHQLHQGDLTQESQEESARYNQKSSLQLL